MRIAHWPMVVSGIGVTAICITLTVPVRPLLVWNATASAPIGLYLREAETTRKRGDLVLIRPAPIVAAFSARRGYLPLHVPLIKRIVGLEGDVVCAKGSSVFLNGHLLTRREKSDGRGRVLPQWSGCITLGRTDVFVAMKDVKDSFDGRYFGPIRTDQIIGKLVTPWTP